MARLYVVSICCCAISLIAGAYTILSLAEGWARPEVSELYISNGALMTVDAILIITMSRLFRARA